MKNQTHSLKRLLFVCLFLLLAPCLAVAQGLEAGLLLGCSNYNGDLSGVFIDFSETKPAAGILIRYNLNNRWTLKGFLAYGRIAGSDSSAAANDYNKARNLSFYSDIFEVSGQVEYNLIKSVSRYHAKKPFIPYVFLGLGVYNFNPKAVYEGKTYELQPKATEGQGSTAYNDLEKYALTQLCVPFGFGVKKVVSKRFSLGIEFGARYTFTNYLDDVGGKYPNIGVVRSTTGEIAAKLSDRSGEISGDGTLQFKEGDKRSNKSIKINDIYFFSGITITYKIRGKAQCPRF